jgi:DNA-binding CsgD family transcriptional regulator
MTFRGLRVERKCHIMERINYSTSSIKTSGNKKSCKNPKNTYTPDVSAAQIAIDAIELIMVLYARSEAPNLGKSIPIITKVPEILSSISEEKKLAIGAVAQSRTDLLSELDERMRQMYFTYMDAYNFEMKEKEIAWLLLKANSTKECVLKMKTSESSFRYSIRRMLSKTKTSSKNEMISKIRNEIEEGTPR